MDKFYIYRRRSWNELDIKTGRINDATVKFAYIKGGKMVRLKPEPVLTALKDLKEGCDSVIKVGSRLPCQRTEDLAHNHNFAAQANSGSCNHKHSRPQQMTHRNGVVCKTDSEIQTRVVKRKRHSTSEEEISQKITAKADIHHSSPKKAMVSNEKPAKSVFAMRPKMVAKKYNVMKRTSIVSTNSSVESLADKRRKSLARSRPESKTSAKKRRTSAPSHRTREASTTISESNSVIGISITENDIDALRSFLIHDELNAKKIFGDYDLLKYDEDDMYKTKLFYKINPAVRIEKSPAIYKMNEQGRKIITKDDFVSVLGLQSVSEKNKDAVKNDNQLNTRPRTRRKLANNNNNNINEIKKGKKRKRDEIDLTLSSDDDSMDDSKNLEEMRRISKEIKSLAKADGPQPTSSFRKEYTNLEDHAIVTWVSTGNRASTVNGNRMWKEFEERFHSITGLHRSWHSLRNRYLRSILPRLDSLLLNPALAKRLRAGAATGEIKARRQANNPPRRNSIFGVATRGALSRLPPRSLSTDEYSLPTNSTPNSDEEERRRSLRNKNIDLKSSMNKSTPRSVQTREMAQREKKIPTLPTNSTHNTDDQERRRSLRNKNIDSPIYKSTPKKVDTREVAQKDKTEKEIPTKSRNKADLKKSKGDAESEDSEWEENSEASQRKSTDEDSSSVEFVSVTKTTRSSLKGKNDDSQTKNNSKVLRWRPRDKSPVLITRQNKHAKNGLIQTKLRRLYNPNSSYK